MSKADASTKQTIANLLINRVKLYPTKAVVEGTIPTHPDVLVPSQHTAPLRLIRDSQRLLVSQPAKDLLPLPSHRHG